MKPIIFVYSEKQKINQIFSEYQKAIDINPNYPDALNNLAGLYFKTSQYEEAMIYWEKVLKIES